MSKRKLLLADDSVTIQKVVNLTFADEGIEVIAVGDGDTAMAKVAEISPDLIMADVNMPGLTGYQICEKIRQDEVLRQTPVILLVGSFEPFDEDEARRVGADDFLTKPFQSIRQLVNKVTVLLNSSNVAERDNYSPVNEVSSFDDTLEMEKEASDYPDQTPQYSDSEFDDEMIQTSQVNSFALDDLQRFETRDETPAENDFAITQPLTHQEIREFNLVDADEKAPEEEYSYVEETVTETEETVEEFADEAEANEIPEDIEEISEEISETEEFAETVETKEEISEDTDEDIEEVSASEPEPAAYEPVETKTQPEEEMPMPEVASILESDEDDLLELPPIEADFEEEEEEEEVSTQSDTEENLSAPASVVESTEATSQISSELIEAIANRVMEKLSEKAVKEVAWEVVPQMTEIIVKKMAEDKLKE